MVWDTSVKIGCGVASGSGGTIVNCQYYVHGNYVGSYAHHVQHLKEGVNPRDQYSMTSKYVLAYRKCQILIVFIMSCLKPNYTCMSLYLTMYRKGQILILLIMVCLNKSILSLYVNTYRKCNRLIL